MIVRFAMMIAMLAALLAGCATYTTPGGPAAIGALQSVASATRGGLTSPNDPIEAAFARTAEARFPASLVLARVQESGYLSASNVGYGRGAFSVVTNRDIETEADLARLRAMPSVTAVAMLNRLLLPGDLDLDDVRLAAAQLHGDVVLLYTFDTSFETVSETFGPLQVVSLGFMKKHNAVVRATCALALLDVRTGYVYGLAESSATEEQRANAWSTRGAIDAARLRAERAAFTAALGEVEKVWAEILTRDSG